MTSNNDLDDVTRVRKLIAAMSPLGGQTLGADAVNDEAQLIADLGFDSIRLMELTVALERVFGLPQQRPERLASVHTVGDVIVLVRETGRATES